VSTLKFFCLFSVLVLLPSTNTVFADEVDELLDQCAIAPDPKPSAMVYDYKLSPEILMPGDVGVLTITLKNMQEEPIEKDVDIKDEIVESYTTREETITVENTTTVEDTTTETRTTTVKTTTEKGTTDTVKEKIEPVKRAIDIDAETRFTMEAYIKEAYIVENDFKVYNRYISAGVIGPDEKVAFAFKIKAPAEEGIYMLKFIADIEDMEGKNSKGIRYFIPVTVAGTLNIVPLEVSQSEVRLEVINEGLSDADCVYVVVSDAKGVEFACDKIYLGRINYGESAIAAFVVKRAEKGENTEAIFKAVFTNGVNEHETNHVCVKIPHHYNGGGEESRLDVQAETAPYSSTFTSPLKSKGVGAAVPAFVAVVTAAMAYLFFHRFRKGEKGEDKGGDEE
jgi:hypothetical protein